jgi:TonB family protein
MPDAPPPPRAPVIAPAIAAVETPAPPPIPVPPPAASPYTTATLTLPPRTERKAAARTDTFSDAAARQTSEHVTPKMQVGSFDGAPAGTINGKPGTGRAVASAAGFDGGITDRAPERSRPLRASGFSDLAMAAPAAAHKTQATSGRETALEILGKPRPAYSDAARRLGLEGDVLLEAAFPASGQVRVLRVIRGLGHGLDENAILAAAGIRYRPATFNGAPVDTIATVRITFQIAN